jgi:hypothetical protein
VRRQPTPRTKGNDPPFVREAGVRWSRPNLTQSDALASTVRSPLGLVVGPSYHAGDTAATKRPVPRANRDSLPTHSRDDSKEIASCAGT